MLKINQDLRFSEILIMNHILYRMNSGFSAGYHLNVPGLPVQGQVMTQNILQNRKLVVICVVGGEVNSCFLVCFQFIGRFLR